MDLKMTITAHLEDKTWGFSDLLKGRKLNAETKEEIRDLIEENIHDAITSSGSFKIETLTGKEPSINDAVASNEGAGACYLCHGTGMMSNNIVEHDCPKCRRKAKQSDL